MPSATHRMCKCSLMPARQFKMMSGQEMCNNKMTVIFL